MAEFVDRIKLIYDVTADKATAGLSGVKGSVQEAEGAFGKLKAGAGSAFGAIGASASTAIAGAGAAIGAFVLKGVSDFEDLADAAKNFSTVAGTSVADASRWLEVADDLGVSAEAVQGAMSRLNREAAAGTLANFGIDAGNANDRLIQTLQYIASIPDEAGRAKAQFDLLGKGGAALAPLIGNVGELRDRLKEVQGGKLIDDKDVADAHNLRDSMDDLSDSWESLQLSVGKTVAPLLAVVAQLAGKLLELQDAVTFKEQKGGSWWDAIDTGAGNLAKSIAAGGFAGLQGLAGLFTDTGHNASDAAAGIDQAADAMAAQKQAADDLNTAINTLNNATLAQFNSQLAFADATTRTMDQMTDYVAKEQTATDAAGGNKQANEDATRAMNDAAQAALAQAAAAVKMASDQATANGQTLSAAQANDILVQNLQQVANTLAPGDPLRQQLEGYIAQLGTIPTEKKTDVTADTSQATLALQQLYDRYNNAAINIFIKPFLPGGVAASSSSAPAGRGLPSGLTALPTAMPTASAASPAAAFRPTFVTYHVAVSAGAVVANEAELGRVVAGALDAHERRVGPRRHLVGI